MGEHFSCQNRLSAVQHDIAQSSGALRPNAGTRNRPNRAAIVPTRHVWHSEHSEGGTASSQTAREEGSVYPWFAVVSPTRLLTISRARPLAVLLACVAISLGCTSEFNASRSTCSLASDCATGLICAFQKCSVACATSRDCPTEEMCLKSDKGAVCRKKETCWRHSECAGEQRCASDGRCRDQCLTSKDCAGVQVCAAGSCVDNGDLLDGALPKTLPGDGLGAPCILSADCPGDYVCLWNNTCGAECTIDRDCPRTYSCAPPTPGGPGRCTPPKTP